MKAYDIKSVRKIVEVTIIQEARPVGEGGVIASTGEADNSNFYRWQFFFFVRVEELPWLNPHLGC